MTKMKMFTDAEYLAQGIEFCQTFYSDWAVLVPSSAVVNIATADISGGGRFRSAGFAPVSDARAIARAAIEATSPTVTGWVSSQILGDRPAIGRGKASDFTGWTALVVDIDHLPKDGGAAAGHKSAGLPTVAQVAIMVSKAEEFLGKPTAMVRTSSEGIQMWWKLDRVLPIDNPIPQRFKAMWATIATEVGCAFDLGVMGDAARMLRCPGQYRVKKSVDGSGLTKPERAYLVGGHVNAGSILTVEQLDGVLPALPDGGKPRTRKTTTNTPSGDAVACDREVPATEAELHLARQLPALAVLDAVVDGHFLSVDADGWEKDGEPEWHMAGAGSDKSAHGTWDEANGYRVSIFSQTAQAALGLIQQPNARRTSADLLREVVMATSYAKAQPVWEWLAAMEPMAALETIQRAVVPLMDDDDLPTWQQENWQCLSALAATAHAVEHDVVPAASEAEAQLVTSENKKPSLLEDIQPHAVTRHHVLDRQYRVVTGGDAHGIYIRKVVRSEEDSEPKVTWRKLTNAVLVRTREMVVRRPTGGTPVDAAYSVFISVPAGSGFRTKTLTGMSPADSLNVRKLLTLANIGGILPAGVPDQQALESFMLNAGLDEQSQRVRYGVVGWDWDPERGQLRYVTPNGSITTDGIDFECRAADEHGIPAHRSGLKRLANEQDFARVDQMLREAFEVHPSRPEIIGGFLSMVWAAPLRPETGTVAYLRGRKDSGKSRLMALAQPWTTGTTRPDHDLKDASPTAIANHAKNYQDTCWSMDDFKRSDGISARKLEERTQALYTAIGALHGGTEASRANAHGGLRARVGEIHGCAVATGELAIVDGSMASKCFQLGTLERGEVDWTPVPVVGLDEQPLSVDGKSQATRADAWPARWSETAAAVQASYIQWLAQRIMSECGGDLARWTASTKARVDGVITGPVSRASGPVALAILGIRTFKQFLSEHGVYTAALDIEDAMLGLVQQAEADQEGSSLESQFREMVMAALVKNAHFICSPDLGTQMMEQAGWKWRTSRDSQEWTASGSAIGSLSEDGRWVRMTMAQARVACEKFLTQEQLREVLRNLTPEDIRARYGGTGSQWCPKPYLPEIWGGRMAGYTLPASVFGIELPEVAA